MKKTPGVLELCLTLDTGGLERIVVNLANAMTRYPEIRPQICTVGKTTGDVLPPTIAPEVRWTELAGPTRFQFRTALKLAGLVRRENIRVIHAHGTQPLVYALFASLITGVSIVATKHNSYEDVDFFIRRSWFNKLACRRVSQFCGVSEQATEILKRVFGPAAKRCSTQINGTELPSAATLDSARKLRTNRRGKPVVISTVCRLAAEKDLTTLLKAFVGVRAAAPTTELWIVGDGPERAPLELLAKELEIGGNVKFLGFRGGVRDLLAESDIFVNSSTTEGISLSILEAMSMGLPIVATAVGGTPSVVRHNENGFLVDAKDPLRLGAGMLRLVQDAELRRAMGENSIGEVERKWSLERMADEYFGMYAQALGLNAGARVALA